MRGSRYEIRPLALQCTPSAVHLHVTYYAFVTYTRSVGSTLSLSRTCTHTSSSYLVALGSLYAASLRVVALSRGLLRRQSVDARHARCLQLRWSSSAAPGTVSASASRCYLHGLRQAGVLGGLANWKLPSMMASISGSPLDCGEAAGLHVCKLAVAGRELPTLGR